MGKNWPTIRLIAVFLAVLLCLSGVIQRQKTCEASGGKYVRGVWWYECVHDGAIDLHDGVTFVAPVNE